MQHINKDETFLPPTVAAQSTEWRYGGYYTSHQEERQIESELEELLRRNGIKPVRTSYGGDKYLIEYKRVNELRSRKFRVYLGEKFGSAYGPRTFVQSNKDGELNIARFIKAARIALDDERAAIRNRKASEKRLEGLMSTQKSLSQKLEKAKSNFKAELSHGQIVIKTGYGVNDKMAELIVEQLIKAGL